MLIYFMLKFIYMPYKTRFLINKQKNTGLKHSNDSKAFIEYSNYMDDVFKKLKNI